MFKSSLSKGFLYVDFSHLSRRAFHISEESQGLTNGTTFSVLRMLKRIKTLYPHHELVCVFDGKSAVRLVRKHILPDYKEARFSPKGATGALLKQSFYPQLDFMYHSLSCLGIWCVISQVFEADVVIASQVCKYPVDKITIFDTSGEDIVMSGDQDYIPMVRGGVSWLRPTGKSGVRNLLIKYSRITVVEEFGVLPKLWPFVKLLLGDPSDGVLGVKGYGKVKSVKFVEDLFRRHNPTHKIEFLKLISTELDISLAVLLPKFLLFDMTSPRHLVNYLMSRMSDSTQLSDVLDYRTPEKSSSKFVVMCRKLGFSSIVGEMSDWVSVFNLWVV